eukprot:gene25147-30368_t
MGPPKRRPRKTPYSEVKRRYDYFEYRWDTRSGTYYLFNPWTGETIFSANLSVLNRQKSMWVKPEKYPVENARFIQLIPEFYMSRQWGRRRFRKFESGDQAALVITALARGFLARLRLRNYYKGRFYTMTDQFSGYLYFVDRENPHAETNWYKPRLAFPNDIQPLEVEDPDDYMKGQRFSKQDFQTGPFIKVAGLSKAEQDRADLQVFIVRNELRNIAAKSYADIDLSQLSIGDWVAWMEGGKVTAINVNEYHFMRTAIEHGDWAELQYYMSQYPDNALIQLFGFHGFAKTVVPLESPKQVDRSAKEAIDRCVEIIVDKDNVKSNMMKVFALRALHNILSIRPGRAEFLETDSVMAIGEFRQAAMEKHLKTKLEIFNKYLTRIPNETILVFERGSDVPQPVTRPTAEAIEIVECVTKCLCLIAQELEVREQLSFIVTQPVIFALGICEEEPYIVMHGLQLLYNLCYRCESGQEMVLLCLRDSKKFLTSVRHKHSADADVMRQARRLELALEPDGWRGNVEAILTREMKAEEEKYDFLGELRSVHK